MRFEVSYHDAEGNETQWLFEDVGAAYTKVAALVAEHGQDALVYLTDLEIQLVLVVAEAT